MASKKSYYKTSAKKLRKNQTRAAFISIVSIILVIAVCAAIIYFFFPATWGKIVSLFDKGNNLAHGEGELKVHMLDVGQGDCIYIQLPDGKDMVIDCANYNDDSAYETKTFNYLDAFITDDTVEYLMLTHCDSDHVYFMDELVERYKIEKIFMPNVLASPGTGSSKKAALQEKINELDTSMFTDPDTIESITYAEFFVAALSEPNCEVSLNMDDNDSTNNIVISETTYKFTFYSPTKQYYSDSKLNTAERKNAISPIGILEYNGKKFMFTGDSNEINEPLVMNRTGKIDCDVLKVGHHGSATSTTAAFLDYYTFEYALISCNTYGNTFKHPRQATLDRLAAHNVTVYRTDKNGNIVVSVDKDGTLSFETEKESTQEANLSGYGAIVKNGNELSAAIYNVLTQNRSSYFFDIFIISKNSAPVSPSGRAISPGK